MNTSCLLWSRDLHGEIPQLQLCRILQRQSSRARSTRVPQDIWATKPHYMLAGVIERWDMPIIDLITVHLTLRCIPKGHVDTPWIPWLQSIPIRFHPVFQLPPCHWQLGLPMIQWRQRFLDQHISDDISALEPLKTVKCILDRQECPSLIGSVWLQLVAAKGPSIGGSSIWTDWEFMQLAWRIQTFRTSLHYCIYEPRWFQWLCCCAGYFAVGAAFQPSFADGYGAGARSLALDWLGSTAIVSCQLSPHESLKWEGSYRQGCVLFCAWAKTGAIP